MECEIPSLSFALRRFEGFIFGLQDQGNSYTIKASSFKEFIFN